MNDSQLKPWVHAAWAATAGLAMVAGIGIGVFAAPLYVTQPTEIINIQPTKLVPASQNINCRDAVKMCRQHFRQSVMAEIRRESK